MKVNKIQVLNLHEVFADVKPRGLKPATVVALYQLMKFSKAEMDQYREDQKALIEKYEVKVNEDGMLDQECEGFADYVAAQNALLMEEIDFSSYQKFTEEDVCAIAEQMAEVNMADIAALIELLVPKKDE